MSCSCVVVCIVTEYGIRVRNIGEDDVNIFSGLIIDRIENVSLYVF